MRRLISRDVLRVATRKSWVLILRIRPDHLFGVGTIYSARTFCQQFFWKGLFGEALGESGGRLPDWGVQVEVRAMLWRPSISVVSEPRTVATGSPATQQKPHSHKLLCDPSLPLAVLTRTRSYYHF